MKQNLVSWNIFLFMEQVSLRMDSTWKVRQWKAEIKRVAGLTSTDVRIVEVHEGLIRKTLSDELTICTIHTSDKLCAFEVLPSSPDIVEIDITQVLKILIFKL